MRKSTLVAAAGLLSVFLIGCDVDRRATGPEQTDSKTIPLDKTEMLRAELRMGAGDLRIRGDSPNVLDASFRYNVASWRPEVRYENTGFRGRLTIEQPTTSHGSSNGHYEWDLAFNNGKPLDLTLNFGAGEAKVDLSHVPVRGVEVNMGVGSLTLDLRGTPKNDYDVRVHGGVGEATLYLPHDAGVIADAEGGIGGIDVSGMQKRDDKYVNDAYEKAHVRVRVEVRGGVGQIRLID